MALKNTLSDLNNHLFAQLERLNDEELKGEELAEELGRAKAITSVAAQIISNGNLVLDAVKLQQNDDKLNADVKVPQMLIGNA